MIEITSFQHEFINENLDDFLDYVNRPIHYIPDDLETLNTEGLQVLTAMHKSYYKHQKD